MEKSHIYQFGILARANLIRHERLEEIFLKERFNPKCENIENSSDIKHLLSTNLASSIELMNLVDNLNINYSDDPDNHLQLLSNFIETLKNNHTVLYYSLNKMKQIEQQSPPFKHLKKMLCIDMDIGKIESFSSYTSDQFFEYEINLKGSINPIKQSINLVEFYQLMNNYIQEKIPSSKVILDYAGIVDNNPLFIGCLYSEQFDEQICICKSYTTIDIYFYILNSILDISDSEEG